MIQALDENAVNVILLSSTESNETLKLKNHQMNHHIISYHIIDLHSSSSIPKNLIKICAAHHPPPFLTQPASSPHPVSTEFGVAAPVLLMVTPRSCSSARVSVKRASPAALALMMPALQILTWGEPLCISRNPSRNQENPKKMERKVERNQKFGLTCFFWWNCGWFHRFKYTNYTILQRTSCFCINVCVWCKSNSSNYHIFSTGIWTNCCNNSLIVLENLLKNAMSILQTWHDFNGDLAINVGIFWP